MKASAKQVAELRRIGNIVHSLRTTLRGVSEGRERCREFLERQRRKLEQLERDLGNSQLEELARRFPIEHGPRLEAARAEIESVNADISEARTQLDNRHERAGELSPLVASNDAVLDAALERLNLTREALGIPIFGTLTELSTTVDA